MTVERTPQPEGLEVIVNAGPFDTAPGWLLERAVILTLSDSGVVTGEISVTLLDDEAIGEMNRNYLSKDRPTDVIAFSLGEEGAVIGDVYVGHDQAVRQAGELGIDPEEELARLAIHGTLHVLGHDHPDGAERFESPMFALQERLLAALLEAGTA